jgi:hypothetical protein
MVCGLSACDVWPVACTANEPASLLLVVCEILRWDEILREPGVLLELCQKLASLLIGQQAKSNRRDQMVTTLGPSMDDLRWKHKKKHQNQSHQLTHSSILGARCHANKQANHVLPKLKIKIEACLL